MWLDFLAIIYSLHCGTKYAVEIVTAVLPTSQSEWLTLVTYNTRDQSVRYAYVTTLAGRRKTDAYTVQAKDITGTEIDTASYEALPLRAVHASLSTAPATLLIPSPLSSNERRTHRFSPTTVNKLNTRNQR
jgi:hypothetical protein